MYFSVWCVFFFSSRRRHTRCALVTGVQTCALPISATPPPDFDLDQAITSLRRFADRSPAGIALAHFGLVPDPMDILVEAEDILTRWAEVATAAWQEDRDIAAALDEAFAPDLAGLDDEAREIMDTLNGVHSNAAGFQRWLDKSANPRP